MPSGVHLTSSVTPDVMRIGAPPPAIDASEIYALAYLGGSEYAMERYGPGGIYLSRAATIVVPDHADPGSDDSALLVPIDSAAFVSPETAVFTAPRTDLAGGGEAQHGIWSWDWRNTQLYDLPVTLAAGESYRLSQVQQGAGWLFWEHLKLTASNHVQILRKRRLNLAAELVTSTVHSGTTIALGHMWMTAQFMRYRHTRSATFIHRLDVVTDDETFNADTGWSLRQGCADPAGGDVGIGGRGDLGGSALNRATAQTSIAAAWSDPVPGDAAQALAASVDTAGNVSMPYLLDDGSVALFHGDPAGAQAGAVVTLSPEVGALLLAVSAKP